MIKSIVKFSQLDDRLDAGYYDPKFFENESILRRLPNIYPLKEISTGQKARFSPKMNLEETINYLDITNVDLINGGVSLQTKPAKSAPSRARRKVEIGDVCISTVRPIRNAVVLITDDLKKIICSTGFAVIKPTKINSEYLFAFLKTRFAINQLVRRTSAAMYPAISEDEVFEILIPIPDRQFQQGVSNLVKQSFKLRQLSEYKYKEAQEILNEYLGITKQKLEFSKTFILNFSKLRDRLDGEFYQPLSITSLPMFRKGTMRLSEVVTVSMGKTPAKNDYTQKGVRILKVRDLTNKGINWSEGNRAFVSLKLGDKLEKSRIKEGDILLISAAHQAYYIGKEFDIVFDIPQAYENKLVGVAELLIVRANNKINPFVLLWYLRTPIAYQFIQQLITGETSHLYPKDLKKLPIPKILSDFKCADEIEKLTKESIILQKKSKQLLERAKNEVEDMIKNK